MCNGRNSIASYKKLRQNASVSQMLFIISRNGPTLLEVLELRLGGVQQGVRFLPSKPARLDFLAQMEDDM